MTDFGQAIRRARPRTVASVAARDRALSAALGGLAAPRVSRRSRHLLVALAAVGAAAAAIAAVVVLAISGGGDAAPRIILPGDDAPAAPARPATSSRPGVAANIVFRPAAGLDIDAAYDGMVRVIEARAASAKRDVDIARVGSDRALVTLLGTRESTEISGMVTGSAVAVYDLDAVLVGTFAGLPGALRRARELAPTAPSRMAYLVRPGGAVRGPAPRAADLRGPSLPGDAEILELPEGYAILRRQYVRNARGDAERLRPSEYLLVRDEPAVTPLQVTGPGRQRIDTTLPGRPMTIPIGLTAAGRSEWDRLLAEVSARAAGLGQPQRIVLTTNGDVWQTTTADAAGRLDTRPGSPALEFGSFMSASGGNGVRQPISGDLPTGGSLPAVVWVADLYRVGPAPEVRGERVSPLPAAVRRAIGVRDLGGARGDAASARRALAVEGPDGTWAVWNYLTSAGSARGLITGPRPSDGFGFTCARGREAIQDCGGSPGFQVFAVPPATTELRFHVPGGSVRVAQAANGWALLLGPRRTSRGPPRAVIRVEAVGAGGRVIGRVSGRYNLP